MTCIDIIIFKHIVTLELFIEFLPPLIFSSFNEKTIFLESVDKITISLIVSFTQCYAIY